MQNQDWCATLCRAPGRSCPVSWGKWCLHTAETRVWRSRKVVSCVVQGIPVTRINRQRGEKGGGNGGWWCVVISGCLCLLLFHLFRRAARFFLMTGTTCATANDNAFLLCQILVVRSPFCLSPHSRKTDYVCRDWGDSNGEHTTRVWRSIKWVSWVVQVVTMTGRNRKRGENDGDNGGWWFVVCSGCLFPLFSPLFRRAACFFLWRVLS